LSPEETFNYVTGLAFEKRGEEFLSEAVKEKEDFSFDYFFNQPRELTADDSSSDDDDDENYVDLTSGDEDITKKSDKPSSRKKKLSKSSP
jgi:hypothetical protein